MKKLVLAFVAMFMLMAFASSCTNDMADDASYVQIASDKDEEPDK